MKQKAAAEGSPEVTPPTIEGTPDERIDASERAGLCGREIEAVLAKHNCRIVPYLKPVETIGTEGAKAIISAGFGIIPDPIQ